MVSQIRTATLLGVEARLIEVEVELIQGLPVFSVIGLGDAAVQEAKYRIQSAVRAAGFELPRKRVTINLAPAGIRKDGAALDLPMALSVLVAAGVLPERLLKKTLAVGELSLSGELRPVRGAISIAALARESGLEKLIVPAANGDEARAVEGIDVITPSRLTDLVSHLRGELRLPPPPPPPLLPPEESGPDLSDVKGQPLARRALELAAAGGHNLLMVGPPGSGKTMLARRLPSILPQLTSDERLEVTKIWSAAGLTLGGGGLVRNRPFRAPHHTASLPALVGGGTAIRPGEVSLAHHGVLFLDEMPEISRQNLESLRQPLEDREVVIARARHVVKLPASFMLVAAANPCPCGWRGDASGRCRCDPARIARYATRLSGPLIDRTDLVIEVPALGARDLLVGAAGETSAAVRRRVEEAREKARARGVSTNARLQGDDLRNAAALDGRATDLLCLAVERLALSARVVDRTLRVARTIADLAGKPRVEWDAVAEALRYRPPVDWTMMPAAA